MFWFGLVSMIALPMIGVFDEVNWNPPHCAFAGIFFGGFMIYGRLLASYLSKNKDKFPVTEH